MFDEAQVSKNEECIYKQRIVLVICMLHGIVNAITQVVKKENYANEVG